MWFVSPDGPLCQHHMPEASRAEDLFQEFPQKKIIEAHIPKKDQFAKTPQAGQVSRCDLKRKN